MTESVRNRFKVYSILFLSVLIGGTAGIMAAEDLSFLNAFYFMIVTMATVGYGDVHPVTAAGKALTILIIITGVGTFVGAIANATEVMLARRDMQVRMNKLNMVIGVFFSEVGLRLLALFSAADPRLEDIRGKLIVTGKWTDQEFRNVSAEIRLYDCTIRTDAVDLAQLQAFTLQKRDFLVRLLENPILLEHETFTDLLRAVFHLTEELAYRAEVSDLPASDRGHLAFDMKRAYMLLISEWLDYMQHLKTNFPYLFSLALRTNPFDRQAQVVVREEPH
jgi:voltage-gated potassium channel